jgi:hypothetical protein
LPGISPTPHLTPKAVLFLLWLIAVNDWLNRHLGVGFDAPVVALAAGTLTTGFGLLEAATGEKLKEQWLGKAVKKLLNFPVMALLYAMLLMALSVVSSVTLLNDPPDTIFQATLTPADRAGEASASQDNQSNSKLPVRFLGVWTRPLGRPYRLAVKGYLPQIFQVYPLLGVTLSPRRELRVSPSVLFRPPSGAFAPMAGGVRIEVWKENGAQRIPVADATAQQQSILVGSDQPVPTSMLDGWRLEAMAQGIVNEHLLAQALEIWRQPLVLAPKNELEPGRVVVAMIYNSTNQPLAQARALLTEDRLQDVRIQLVGPKERHQ